MTHRRTWLLALLLLSLVTAAAAGLFALDALFVHGFAPACGDGYAEANGTAPCSADWGSGLPRITIAVVALAIAIATVPALRRERPARLPRQ